MLMFLILHSGMLLALPMHKLQLEMLPKEKAKLIASWGLESLGSKRDSLGCLIRKLKARVPRFR